MKYPGIVIILAICGFVMKIYADSSVADGLARIILLQQGYTPEEISRAEMTAEYSNDVDGLNYYENYSSEITTTFESTSGPIKGAQFEESYAFYSIPFAKPPVRFQPPEPITEKLSMIDATRPNILVCEQLKKNCSNGVCTQNTNEDCLVLNIHVPRTVSFDTEGATSSIRPVLVWFHGGGFFGGAGTLPEFEARWFAKETDKVIVAINYRLGAFGFFVHGDGENEIKGNQGLKDQQLALKWIQDNIGKFGGDRNSVTLFGNSAGAQSVMFHLLSDVSKNLFNRAIMESNPAVFQYQTPEEAKRVSARLIKILQCEGTVEEEQNCLMKADASAINKALLLVMPYSLVEDQDLFSTIEAFRPVIDSEFKMKQPLEMFRDGEWQTEKDVILGTNTNELEIIQYFIPSATPNGNPIPFPRKAFELLNRFLFGNETGDLVSEKYIKEYGDGIRTDYRVLLGIEAGHMFFMCPSRILARFASNTSKEGRIYLYSNAQPMDGDSCREVVRPPEMCGLAFHGGEPPFVFRSGPFYGYKFNQSDTEAANQFDHYWSNFASTGNPSLEGSDLDNGYNLGPYEKWPEYKLASTWQNIIIDGSPQGNSRDNAYLEDICNFWDSLNYYINISEQQRSTTTPTSTTEHQQTTSGSFVICHHFSFTLMICFLMVMFIHFQST